MSKISIIIPVYNVEKYLADCIDSILVQSYKNFEVILVNDGSTDESLKICLDYEKRDNRVIVINQSNQGQGKARNVGISNASGEYYMFIDSDDYLSNATCLEKIAKKIDDDVELIIYGLVRNISMNTIAKERVRGFLNLPMDVDSGERYILEMTKLNPYFPWGPCNIAYSRKYWEKNNFCFKEGIVYEDLRLMWRVICGAKKVSIIREILYVYRVDQEKSTTKTINPFVITCHLSALRENVYDIDNLQYSEKLKAAVKETFATDYYSFLLSLLDKPIKNELEVKKQFEEVFFLFKDVKLIPKYVFVRMMINLFGFSKGTNLVYTFQKIKNTISRLKIVF